MNNIKEKIIKYLDDQLDVIQLADFEKQLEIDSKLKQDVEKYRAEVKQAKELNLSCEEMLDDNYFKNIIPKFHIYLEHKQQKKFVFQNAFAYSTVIVTSVVLLFFSIPFFQNNIDKSLTDEEFVYEDILTYYNNHFNDVGELTATVFNNEDTILDYMILDELNLNTYGNYFLQNFNLDYHYIINDESEDFEEIFNEMINTKLL